MVYINRTFPSFSENLRYAYGPLQAPGYRMVDNNGIEEIYSGSLTYLEFITLVKKLWEESHPLFPILPMSLNRESSVSYTDSTNIFEAKSGSFLDSYIKGQSEGFSASSGSSYPSSAPGDTVPGIGEYPAIIGYHLELRKSHTTEPKPRMRQNVVSPANNHYTIYGQRFQNIIGFTVMCKVGTFQGPNGETTRDDLDAAVLSDQIIEEFENFMLEYTPILKAAGAAELVYSRRLADSELNRAGSDIHKRTVTYMLTTEKTYAIKNERIEKIAVDARTWMAYEKELLRNQLATPNLQGTTGNIVDLFQTATPNY